MSQSTELATRHPPVERDPRYELLRLLIDRSDDLVVAIDDAYRLLIFNETARREVALAFGVTMHPGDNVLDLAPTEHREQARAMWTRAISGESFRVVQEAVDLRGRPRFYELRCAPLPTESGIRGAYYVAHDVTERVQNARERERLNELLEKRVQERTAALETANRKLRRQDELLHAALRASHTGTFYWDLAADTVSWDASTYGIFDLATGAGPANSAEFLALVHVDDRASVRAALADAASGDPDLHLLFRTTVSDGTERWIQMHARFYPADESTVPHLTGACTDVTEHKRAQQALAEAVQTRDRFLSIASHELRTPLTSLALQLRLGQRRLRTASSDRALVRELRPVLERSEHQAARLGALIDDLLDVSRIQAGRLEFALEPVDLSQLVEVAVENYRENLDNAGCRTRLDLMPAATGVWDPLRLEQVVSNLLSNCIRYAPGTEIAVSVAHTPEAATLRVRDTGPGIADADRSQIFERFGRGTAAVSEGRGLGLGLYLVKELVDGHHGHIELESEPGRGTSFTIRLPRTPPA